MLIFIDHARRQHDQDRGLLAPCALVRAGRAACLLCSLLAAWLWSRFVG